jgi:hypothetical protein
MAAASRRRNPQKRPKKGQVSAAARAPVALPMAHSWVPKRLRPVVFALATIYLVSLFLNAAAKGLPGSYLPPALLYFVQTTRLFPTASRAAIDYRLEGWDCGAQQFREITVAQHFPMHAKDKENRFQRVGHFYRQHRVVMRALERYVIEKENAKSSPGSRVGGIRVSSLRIPFAELGGSVHRWSPRPMSEYSSEQIKRWYYTPVSRKNAFCNGNDPDEGASLTDGGTR